MANKWNLIAELVTDEVMVVYSQHDDEYYHLDFESNSFITDCYNPDDFFVDALTRLSKQDAKCFRISQTMFDWLKDEILPYSDDLQSVWEIVLPKLLSAIEND